MSANQRFSGKVAEKCKKVGLNIWLICCKAVILHPLSRGKRDEVEMLKTGDEVWTSTAWKEIFKKNLEKFWWFKNLPYLCIRFPKESLEEEFFERFRYKQASSTSFVWNMTKNRNRQYLKQVNKQIRFLSRLKLPLTGKHDILQWRVWSWLRMNASYRLNTCKSRGSTVQQCTGGDRRTGA